MQIDKFLISNLRDISIELVAEALGLKVEHHRSLCPWHGDTHPSLTYSRSRNTCHCFVCDTHADTIALAQAVLQCSFRDAIEWLSGRFGYSCGFSFSDIKPQKIKPLFREERPKAVDLAWLEKLIKVPRLSSEAQSFLFAERRLKQEAICHLGITSIVNDCPSTSAPVGLKFRGPALLFPYRDIDGGLLSVQARYIGKQKNVPRFQFPAGSRCPIFNLPEIKLAKITGRPLFITEGVTDCLAMLSSGNHAIAIPSATILCADDLAPLAGLRLHMYPDNDSPGQKLFFHLREILKVRYKTDLNHHLLDLNFKDFAQYYSYKMSNNQNDTII